MRRWLAVGAVSLTALVMLVLIAPRPHRSPSPGVTARTSVPYIASVAFPLATKPHLHKGLRVYWYHRVAGRVLDLTEVGARGKLLVELRIEAPFVQKARGSTLRVFHNPRATWIGIISSPAHRPGPRSG